MKKIFLCAVAGAWFLFAGCTKEPVLTMLSGDVVVKTYSGAAYVIDRTNATLTRINIGGSGSRLVAIGSNTTSEADVEIIDLVAGTSRQILKSEITYQVRIGDNTNPQDIVFESAAKAYITQLGGTDVLVVNPVNGSIVKRISLARFNNSSNTVPCASSALIYGTKLYVACQRLTAAYAATLPGVLAVISTAADSVVDSIVLEGKNPYAMDTIGSQLYISMSADFYTPADEGIEAVDLSADSSLGYLCNGTVLRSYPTIMQASSAALYVSVGWPSSMKIIDRTMGSLVDSIAINSSCMARIGTTLYIGDGSVGTPGIASLNTLTNTLAAGRIRMSMPPYSLAILE